MSWRERTVAYAEITLIIIAILVLGMLRSTGCV
jgi:hypothetical protein